MTSTTPAPQHRSEQHSPYPIVRRWADTWAGYRDRRTIPDLPEPILHTEWLAALAAECLSRQEEMREVTRRELSALDKQIAHAAEHMTQARGEIDRRRAELPPEDQPMSETPTTCGEIYNTTAEILARRHRENTARRAQITARIAALQDEIARQHEVLTVALAERRSLWAELIVQATRVDAHHRRRAHCYLRSATRRNTPVATCAELAFELPGWAHPDAIPDPPAH